MINSRLKKVLAVVLVWTIALDSPAVVLAQGSTVGELRSNVETRNLNPLSRYELYKEKNELAKGISEFSKLTPGEDYIENCFAVEADTREEAERIAECYGGDITVYDNGIGTMTVSSNFSTWDILEIAADTDNQMPVVYPEYIYTLDEGIQEGDGAQFDSEHAAVASCDGAQVQALPTNAPNDYEGQDSSRYWQHTFTESFNAWGVTRGSGVRVAVIDTGIDVDHEDLQGENIRLDLGYNAVSARYVSISGNQVVDDANGHGTHVAGIIGAEAGNGIGIAGIAPDAELVPIRVFSDEEGSGSTSTLLRALNYAVSLKVDVVNMSLGGPENDVAYKRAFKEARKTGMTVVCSAGNSGQDNPNYPGACEGTISVAALQAISSTKGKEALLAYYSNFGSTVDIAAPGSSIYSTYTDGSSNTSLYRSLNGTSMAAPVVTGIVALTKSANRNLLANNSKAVDRTQKIIFSTARDESYYCNAWIEGKGSSESPWVWRGVNAANAVSKAAKKVAGLKLAVAEINDDGELVLGAENSGACIMYSIGSKKNMTKYTGPISVEDILAEKGKFTVYTRAVLGKKKGKIQKRVFTAQEEATSVIINEGEEVEVAPGKHVRLTMATEPYNAALPKLTWESTDPSFYIKGSYLYCRKNTSKGVTATLTAYAGDRKVGEVHVRALKSETLYVSPALLDNNTAVMTAAERIEKYASPCDYEVETISVNGISGRIDLRKYIVCDGSDVRIRSSRPAVVTVENNRYLVANKAGKARITVAAADGSGRKSSFLVKVVMPVYKISAIKTSTGFVACDIFNGNRSKNDVINTSYKCETRQAAGGTPTYTVETIPIAVGGEIRLKAYLNDDCTWKKKNGKGSKKPTDGTLEWTSSDPDLLTVTDDGKNIIVTTASANGIQERISGGENIYGKKTVSVTARAKDGFGAERTIDFMIYADPGIFDFTIDAAQKQEMLPEVGSIVAEEKFVKEYLTCSGVADGVYRNFRVGFDHDRLMRVPIVTVSQGGKERIKSFGKAGNRMFYYRQAPGAATLTYITLDGTGNTFGFTFGSD